MSRRALLWSIAGATTAFFYLAASYSGPGPCTTLNFTQWGKSYFLFTGYSGNYRCEVLPRVAVLLIGLVTSLVLVYFAEKGRRPAHASSGPWWAGWPIFSKLEMLGRQPLSSQPEPASAPAPPSRPLSLAPGPGPDGHWVQQDHGDGVFFCIEEGCDFETTDEATVQAHRAPQLQPLNQASSSNDFGFGDDVAATAQAQASEPSGDGAFKTCPDCAEQVRTAARKCRFCGYRFDLDSNAEAHRT